MYKLLIRPILFCFDPEKVHYFTFSLIRNLSKIPGIPSLFRALYVVNDKRLEKEVFGLKFKNPVGLAAGMDKDASLYTEFSTLGFGFIEIGTITPKGQEGNPKKRIFRLVEDPSTSSAFLSINEIPPRLKTIPKTTRSEAVFLLLEFTPVKC